MPDPEATAERDDYRRLWLATRDERDELRRRLMLIEHHALQLAQEVRAALDADNERTRHD